MEIIKKLSKIASNIKAISKNDTNKDDKYSYRNIYDIYNSLNPLFKSEGVFVIPNVLESSETVVNTNKGRAFRIKVKVEWSFYASDGSNIKAISFGEGIDASDKATNKALTASFKYLLIYMFLIPTKAMIDGDSETITVDPFEKSSVPNSLLALVESKGMTRQDLKNIGLKLNMNPDQDLTAEQRKKLYDYILPKSKEELI